MWVVDVLNGDGLFVGVLLPAQITAVANLVRTSTNLGHGRYLFENYFNGGIILHTHAELTLQTQSEFSA